MRHIALQGRQHVHVPPGPIRFSVHAGNGSTPVLQAWRDDERLSSLRDRPGVLTLRDVHADVHAASGPDRPGSERRTTTIRVCPAEPAEAFGPRTVVRLTITVDAGVEQYEISLQPVDVSALPVRDLVSVVPTEDGRLRVTALDAVPDLKVGPLAERARGEARRVLGHDRVRDDRAVRMAIGIDVSASMAHALRDGSVRAAVDLLGGLWQVVGHEAEFPLLCLLGDEPRWLPPVEPAAMATAVAGAVEELGFELGSRSRLPELPGPEGGRPTVRFVVTDGVPPDVDRSAGRDAAGAVTLVVVGGGLLPDDVPDVPLTVLPAMQDGQDAAQRLLASADDLVPVVRSLLRQCVKEPS